MRFRSLLALGSVCIALAFAILSETPTGTVSGKVQQSTGKPAPGARVVLIPLDRQNEGAWFRARTETDGSFKLAPVDAGKYRLLAQHGRERLDTRLQVQELAGPEQFLKLEAAPTTAPPPVHPLPDPAKVQQRARDIIRSRFVLNRPLLDTIRSNDRSGLPLPLVLAQAGAESSFRPELGGKLDEVGLFQLRPSTARDQELGPFTEHSLKDAATSTRLATRYLGRLKRLFQSNRTALAAYNQGQGRTQREGLYPIAQLYADAIHMAAYHDQFRARILQLDPGLKHHWPRTRRNQR